MYNQNSTVSSNYRYTVSPANLLATRRDFAFSYGISEIVPYTPPLDCGEPGSWAAVTLNFTVTSNGTQYDRLAIFTFQNVEIWRSSTPEPTRGDGIIWTYIKDVTRYTPLFAKDGTFILQLDNIIQTGLDGVYSTVLYATFYASSKEIPPAKTSDLIVPISTFKNDTGNAASVPPGFSVNVNLPQDTVQVFAELYASGNAAEEFWVSNYVLFNIELTIPTEVRLLVDGQLAGVAFPYITIFTGGFVPAVWRPISSYGALDLPTYFLDLTPFAPLLADGKTHQITIDVASSESDHATLQNWYVSGVLQVFTDPSKKPTTGKITRYSVKPFAQSKTTGTVRENGDVVVTVSATRKLSIEADVVSGSGNVNHVVWSQALEFSNTQYYLDNTKRQNIKQTSTGQFISRHNGVPRVIDRFSYPIQVNYTILSDDGNSWKTDFDHSYDRDLLPLPILVRSAIEQRQTAVGFYNRAPTGNFGNGTNNNTFRYVDWNGNTYRRRVNAAYNNVTLDEVSGTLAPASGGQHTSHLGENDNSSVDSKARVPGRSV
ncbi:hypothetical protein EST38_g5118 [Candolleomyces aberdarensis]|uniref:Peptide N-acetyl-beta-D-glucosaminyl asparaginase amidase A N-terminal domain-containing protein n=1 Tax=Candolleomyces aberdarensis TaxID=2316362 RepID=A0A4Q2DKW8_9AGAR|nr:hypothetical protein EST38_g5118 [Candolleomyces aberdarensis]